MPISKLNRTVIEAAILGFESQKTEIDAQITELRQMLDGGPTSAAATPGAPTGKRSAAARRRMALAQKKRWASIRRKSEPAPAPKPKRKLSAAAKAELVANLKKARASKAKKAKSAATKKTAPAPKKVTGRKAAAKKTAAAQATTQAAAQ